MAQANKRILSIQSHVVSGYVGNKAAVFPLQLLGFDVDVVNSVQFSNHTGYPKQWEGEVLGGDMLLRLIDGLERNELLGKKNNDDPSETIGHMLTGYIGSESFLRAVVTTVQKLKAYNPSMRYVCDPVLGDVGKFYVPKELVAIYRTDVLPLADVITPNQFETEQLTGVKIKDLQDAKHACGIFHEMGVRLVLITSIIFDSSDESVKPTSDQDQDAAAPPNSIGMFASRRGKVDEQFLLYTPKFPGQFTGTGDVTAALFLAWTDKLDLGEALEKLAGSMHAIVERTYESSLARQSNSSTVASRELRVIQSRDDIITPPITFRAMRC